MQGSWHAEGASPYQAPPQQGTHHGFSLLQIKILQTQAAFPLFITIFPRKKDLSSHPGKRASRLPHTTRLSSCPQMALEPCGEAFGHTNTLMCTSYSPCPAHV